VTITTKQFNEKYNELKKYIDGLDEEVKNSYGLYEMFCNKFDEVGFDENKVDASELFEKVLLDLKIIS